MPEERPPDLSVASLAAKRKDPYCFVSYSSREAHVKIFIDCLQLVFGPRLKVECTPSVLEAGASQRDRITELIRGCQFGVVLLDGLRPNVVFEYGIMHGADKPVLLFKEKEATVDIPGFFDRAVELGLESPPVNCDIQFSDVKDVNYAPWERFNIRQTVKLIWEEYQKKKKAGCHSSIHRHRGAETMVVVPTRTTYLYGAFDIFSSIGAGMLGFLTSSHDVAIEILREFSPTELIGRLLWKGASGNWTRVSSPAQLKDYGWYQEFKRTGKGQFYTEGSQPWEVLFFRSESDETGSYVAVGLAFDIRVGIPASPLCNPAHATLCARCTHSALDTPVVSSDR